MLRVVLHKLLLRLLQRLTHLIARSQLNLLLHLQLLAKTLILLQLLGNVCEVLLNFDQAGVVLILCGCCF